MKTLTFNRYRNLDKIFEHTLIIIYMVVKIEILIKIGKDNINRKSEDRRTIVRSYKFYCHLKFITKPYNILNKKFIIRCKQRREGVVVSVSRSNCVVVVFSIYRKEGLVLILTKWRELLFLCRNSDNFIFLVSHFYFYFF